jgi:hypothetical protein
MRYIGIDLYKRDARAVGSRQRNEPFRVPFGPIGGRDATE